MKVNKELYLSKKLANNEYPIIIRLYHKKTKVVSTGVSTLPEYWNKEKSVIKCQDKKYKEKNKIINDEFLRIQQRISEFDAIDRPYDLNLIASDDDITVLNDTEEIEEEEKTTLDNFIDVLNEKIEDYTNAGTKRNYEQLKNVLTEHYGNEILIKNINQKWFNNFQTRIKDKGIKQAREIIKRFKWTYDWGFNNGLILNYKPLNYNTKEYAFTIEKRSLGVEEFTYLKLLFSTTKDWNDECDFIRDDNYTFKNSSLLNALNIYMIIVAMGGISPIDISLLRIKDLKYKEKNSTPLDYTKIFNKEYLENFNKKNKLLRYYHIEYMRKKTGKSAEVFPDADILNKLIKYYLLDKNGNKKDEDEYFLNIFKKDEILTDNQIYSRISNSFNILSKTINTFLEEEKTAPIKHITYYSARYVSLNMMNYAGVEHNLIASNAGHNTQTLEKTYLSDFNIEKMIEANKKIWE